VRRGAWMAVVALLLALALLVVGAPAALAGEAAGAFDTTVASDTTTAHTAADSLSAAVRDSLAAAVDSIGNPFEKPPRDTTGAPIHYNTTYSVNRNLANWSQVLNVDTYWKDVHIDNSTNIAFREDTERKQRTGTRSQALHLSYARPRGLAVGLSLDMDRNNDGPIVNGRVKSTSSISNTNVRLTLSDSLVFSEHHFLRAGLEGGRVSGSETGGIQRNSSGNDLVEILEWTYVPIGPAKLQFTGRNSNTSTDATGSQPGQGIHGQDTTLSATTHNRNKDLNLNGQARLNLPWRNLTASLSGTHTDTRQQQPTLGRQETLTQKNDNLAAGIGGRLVSRVQLNLDVNANKTLVLSDVDSSRNYDTRSTGGTMTLNYSGGPLGTVHATLGDRLNTNDFRKRLSGSLQDVSEHTLVASLQKSLMQNRFNLQLNLSASLSATRYDNSIDTVYNPQDQDYLNRRIGGTLTYTPGGRVSMTFQASEVLSHYVYLHEKQSGKSATDRLYSIEYDIRYALSPALTVNQSYIVSADATISDFENYPGITSDNRYTKTTSYITGFHHALSKRVGTDFAHNLRFTRSGTYNLDPFGPSGTARLFGESSKGQSNDLMLKVSYKIADWISGVGTTRAQYTHQDGLDSRSNPVPISRQQVLELNLGASVNYPFSDRAKLTGTFSRSVRTDSYTPYVNGKVGTRRQNDRDFFLISATFDLVMR
jgi:hypothetical protein